MIREDWNSDGLHRTPGRYSWLFIIRDIPSLIVLIPSPLINLMNRVHYAIINAVGLALECYYICKIKYVFLIFRTLNFEYFFLWVIFIYFYDGTIVNWWNSSIHEWWKHCLLIKWNKQNRPNNFPTFIKVARYTFKF